MAYGRRGIGDWIPTGGEGRALVEVKGKVGKVRGYRTSRNKFRRMRNGFLPRKKPLWLIPKGPGENDGANVANLWSNQRHLVQLGSPQVARGPSIRWAFAITPEPMPGANNNYSVIGNREGSNTRLRIAGMTGKLIFTPLAPSGYDGNLDNNDQRAALNETSRGIVAWAWYKVRAQRQLAGEERGQGYPWRSFSIADAENGVNTQGFVPFMMGLNSTDPEVEGLDWRGGVKLMHSGMRAWRMDLAPSLYTGVSQELLGMYVVGGIPVEIPLPRKLVCDVGEGEALGMVLFVRDFSDQAEYGGSPEWRLDYASMRIKAYELD